LRLSTPPLTPRSADSRGNRSARCSARLDGALGDDNRTYAEAWAGAINETYSEVEPEIFLDDEDLLDGENYDSATWRILTKAADCWGAGQPLSHTRVETQSASRA
jgi:hypothetical protein